MSGTKCVPLERNMEILPNKSGKVRDRLCIEDVYIPDKEVMVGFGLLTIEEIEGEKVYWFRDPIRVPKFNKFYASRIKAVNDPYLLELIRRLIYLNPNPDNLMVKKLVEFIILQFSSIQMRPSKVKDDMLVPTPVLTFEQVEPLVKVCASSRMFLDNGYVPDNEVPVLFQRDSKIDRYKKASIISEYRGYLVKKNLESAIQTAAEMLIDDQEYLKVTNTRIQKSKMVVYPTGDASVKVIRKYMSSRTKNIINEHNSIAPFASEATLNKFLDFQRLEGSASLEEVSSLLKISKSTAVEFKKLKNLLSLTNL